MGSYKGIPVPVRRKRLGVIIGPNGSTKKTFEEAFNISLIIDSENATIYILPGKDASPLNVIKARQAIEAVSLGFSPEDALLLSKESFTFDEIDLSEMARNRSDLHRIKSRVIGEGGRAKKTIEQMTKTRIVVGDKIISIIGEYDNVAVARKALIMLAEGRKHGTVYSYLRREARELKRKELQLWREKLPF